VRVLFGDLPFSNRPGSFRDHPDCFYLVRGHHVIHPHGVFYVPDHAFEDELSVNVELVAHDRNPRYPAAFPLLLVQYFLGVVGAALHYRDSGFAGNW
jgi:hypothetical protein